MSAAEDNTSREDIRAWESMAAWWDQKQGDDGDPWHRALIDPTVFRVLGSVAGQDVLDLACGNGYIARRLAKMGARVTGVDASAPVIALAKEREDREPLGIAYHMADAADLNMLPGASFHVAVCNMGLMDIADSDGVIRETARVLRPGGRFVASVSHPCFDVPGASGWVVERMGLTTTVWRKVGRYREILSDWIGWRVEGVEKWRTKAYHRPLSWYFRVLRQAGLVVSALEEPEPTEELIAESPQGPWLAEISVHVVLEARKMTV